MNGLILAGGRSSRMGQPKGLLDYHGKPQYRYVAEMLSVFCERVFVSCRAEQQTLFDGYEVILDSASYGDIGPLNGVLSAFDKEKNLAWLVVGCDYPLLQPSDFEQLVQEKTTGAIATVFFNPETHFIEPLIGIYEASAGSALQSWFQIGEQSLRRFLEKQQVQKVIPKHPERLKSVDTWEAYKQVVDSLI